MSDFNLQQRVHVGAVGVAAARQSAVIRKQPGGVVFRRDAGGTLYLLENHPR